MKTRCLNKKKKKNLTKPDQNPLDSWGENAAVWGKLHKENVMAAQYKGCSG